MSDQGTGADRIGRHPNYQNPYARNRARDSRDYKTDYVDFFRDNAPWIQPILDANPDKQSAVKDIIWTYGSVKNFDEMIDRLTMGGYNQPNGAGGGGRGRGGGGGGGGGGASKAQQYAAAEAAIRNQAAQMGVPLDDGGIKALAQTVVDNQWSNDQLIDYLEPAATGPGTVTASVDLIKKLASQNLLTVSDATAREWAGRLVSEELTMEGVQSMLQAKATEKYGWAASQIKQGIGVRDMLLPTRDLIANELEMAPEEIDLMDTKWLSMVQTIDSKTNENRAATDSEAIMRARKDSQYANTRAAGANAARIATSLRGYLGG